MAKDIAAVPGVDVLLIRTNDLCAEMGLCGQHRGDGLIAGLTIIVVDWWIAVLAAAAWGAALAIPSKRFTRASTLTNNGTVPTILSSLPGRGIRQQPARRS
jgi:2-keto-3-deoxy-L-rhamnonate aldolase RhmA